MSAKRGEFVAYDEDVTIRRRSYDYPPRPRSRLTCRQHFIAADNHVTLSPRLPLPMSFH